MIEGHAMGLKSLDSIYSTPETGTFGCLICLKDVPCRTDKAKGQEECSELFEVLCKCLEWRPPSKYRFNFDVEDFPLCKDCISLVTRLYKYNQLLLDLQKQIDRGTANVCVKILESQNSKRLLNGILSPNSCDQPSSSNEDLIDIHRKIRYYRNVVYRRYSTSVRLNVDPHLESKESNPENRQEGLITNDSFVCKEELTKDKINLEEFITERLEFNETGSVECSSSEVGKEKDVKEVCDADLKLKKQECSDDYVPVDEIRDDFDDDLPGFLSEEEEEFYDEESKSLSKTSSVNDELNKHFRRTKYRQRVSFVGKEDLNLKFLFDNSYPFELSSEGNWTCCTCNYVYYGKKNLLFHLASTCKGVQKKQKHHNKEGKTSKKSSQGHDSSFDDEIEEIEDHPFRNLKDRVEKIGGSNFRLDNRCRFECTSHRWRCISCNINYRTKKNLGDHIKYCPGDPPSDVAETHKVGKRIYDELKTGEFQCRHCKSFYSSRDTMITHLEECHVGVPPTRKRQPCYIEVEPNKYICNKKFPFEFIDENFKCGTCSTNFTAISEILTHIQENHISVTRCVIYTKTSTGKYFYDGFSFQKTGDVYKCNHCTQVCPMLQPMKDHLKRSHINVKKYFCQTCGRRFNRSDDLRKHEVIHQDDRPYICELCGKSFKLLGSLRIHTARAHLETAEKKFSCDVCGQTYGFRTLLRTHLKTHELVICHVCGKEVTNAKLPHHLETHNEDNICKVCGKKIYHKRAMIIHQRNHAGIKPYSCDICKATFADKWSMKKHKARSHNPNKVTNGNVNSRKRKLKDSVSDSDDGSQTVQKASTENTIISVYSVDVL